MDSEKALDIITQIGGRRSTNFKESELRRYDCALMRNIMLFTYSPHYTYHMKQVPIVIGKIGDRVFDDLTWKILKALDSREISGANARRTVHRYMMQLLPKSRRLFRMILLKDLRGGFGVKTVNKAYPNLIPEFTIMLANEYDRNRVTFPCFVSEKIDGLRGVYHNGHMFSRNGHKYKGLDHITEELKARLLPTTVLDGELLIPGVNFDKSSGSIRSYKDSPDVRYFAFDVPTSIELSYKQRYAVLRNAIAGLEYTRFVKHVEVNSHKMLDSVFQYSIDDDGEGIMVKTPNHYYQNGRSWEWMKRKKMQTVDLEVVNIYTGEGKYTGMLGGVVVMYEGEYVEVGSGFSDWDRYEFMEHPEKILGKIIEIEYLEISSKGRLRHPRFIRIRHDK